MKGLIRYLIPVFISSLIYCIPVPEGLDIKGWKLLSIFIGTIVALVTKPLPMGGVSLIALSLSIITGVLDESVALEGFSSSVSWLVLLVFVITRGFINTGLGNRIGYFFMKHFGKTSLGLGYSLVATDFLVAPFMPSSTARAGGVIFPIFKSISEAFGSKPGDGTEKKLGAFLSTVCFHSNYITSAMFLTSLVANSMIQSVALSYGIDISWSAWAIAAIIPGIASLLVIPLFIYYIYPPEIKLIDQSREFADKKLKELGRVKLQEKIMIIVFISLILLWIFSKLIGIKITTASLLGVCALLVLKIISFDDFLKEKEAWHTLLWLSILITLSGSLEKLGVIGWFSSTLGVSINIYSKFTIFIIVTLVYFYSHYFFASLTTHVGAMYPAFLALLLNTGFPPLLSALILGFTSSLYGSLTHYGSSGGVVFFSANYVPINTWWKIGFYASIINILIWGITGGIWWKIIGLY